jgi:hypothetical protein
MYTVVATFLGSRRYCFSIIVFENTPVYIVYQTFIGDIEKSKQAHFTLHGHSLTVNQGIMCIVRKLELKKYFRHGPVKGCSFSRGRSQKHDVWDGTRVSPFRLTFFFAFKRNKANLYPFHMCFTISL